MLPGEKVTRLRFLIGQSKWVDLLLGLNLQGLDQAAQLGDRGLLLVFVFTSRSPMVWTLAMAPKTVAKSSSGSHHRLLSPGPGSPKPSRCI